MGTSWPGYPGFAKWTTTAEQVGGKTYIYYDFPNDQDPHLIIDEDLTDGKPGKNMGMALNDPSHGSDCAVIRDLEGNSISSLRTGARSTHAHTPGTHLLPDMRSVPMELTNLTSLSRLWIIVPNQRVKLPSICIPTG